MNRKETQVEADNALQLLTIIQKELVGALGEVGKIMITHSDGGPVEQVAMWRICLAYRAMTETKNALEKVVPKTEEGSLRSSAVAYPPRFDCNCGCAAGCAWEKA